jgi:hypothetical protein
MSGLITVLWVAAVLAASVYLSIFAVTSINDLVGLKKEARDEGPQSGGRDAL